jgi:L-rhamnose 1-dehydrogenase
MALLADKVVCITGSSRGIGRACAIESAKHGATGLILHYFGDQETEAELQSLKVEIHATTHNNCRVVGVPGDIADSGTSQQVRYL